MGGESLVKVNIFGTEGRIEIEIPFAAPADRPCKLRHQRASVIEEIDLETCNHYTRQGELFSLAILEDTEVPTSLEDAVANMRTIDALVRSAKNKKWVQHPAER